MSFPDGNDIRKNQRRRNEYSQFGYYFHEESNTMYLFDNEADKVYTINDLHASILNGALERLDIDAAEEAVQDEIEVLTNPM